MKKKSWTHEGPNYSKERERERVGHMKVQVFKSKREKDSSCPKKERKKERER